MTRHVRTPKDAHLLAWSAGLYDGSPKPTKDQMDAFKELHATEMDRVDRAFEFIETGWESALPGRHATGRRPREGRSWPYPGRFDPFHIDAHNERHHKWARMVLNLMVRGDVDWALHDLTLATGWSKEALKPLLQGDSYGKGEVRVDVTFALSLELVRGGMGLRTLAHVLENGGHPMPPEMDDRTLWLDGGRVRRKAPPVDAEPPAWWRGKSEV